METPNETGKEGTGGGEQIQMLVEAEVHGPPANDPDAVVQQPPAGEVRTNGTQAQPDMNVDNIEEAPLNTNNVTGANQELSQQERKIK